MFPKAGDSPAVLPDGVGAEMAEVCAGGREGEGRFKAMVCVKHLEQCPQQIPALMSAARAAYLHGEHACIYGPERGCDFSRSRSLCMHNLIIF